MADWLAGCGWIWTEIGWRGWLAGWLAGGWLAGCRLAGWLAGWLANRLASQNSFLSLVLANIKILEDQHQNW